MRVPSFLAALVPLAAAVTREITWNITYTEANPDGLFTRRVIGVNNTWPPPPIIGFDGDTIMLTAINGLPDTQTSLHAHGNYFVGMPQYDGSVGVSQCGIPPGERLVYEIPFKQGPGTYWIHGHFNGQYVDGLRAPYIIQEATEPQTYGYDDEFTVILGDWYHEQHYELMQSFLTESNPTGAEPVPQSGLIYFAHNDTYLPGFNENATLPFEPGKTYRLRIINMAAFSMFFVWLEGHTMSVIEADGVYTEPYPIDILSISVAQRYSVIVQARNDTSSNWIFHATQNADMYDTVPDDLVLNTTAVVQYSPTAALRPPTDVDTFPDFNDTLLVPLQAQAMEPATYTINLTATFDTFSDGTPRAAFNDIVYNPALTPSLFTMLSMGNESTQDVVYGPGAYVLPQMTTVEIELINGDTGLHPFHLHGHKFQIVQKNMNVTEPDPVLNPDLVEGQANPMRRDTVTVPAQGSVTIRFQTNNPGAWLFHCHIDWHLAQGLALVLIEDPTTAQQTLSIPSTMADQCRSDGQSATGNAAGFNSTTDFDGLTEGPYVQTFGFKTKGALALAGCIVTALLGIATVIWYSFFGATITDEEHEHEIREARARKAAAGGGYLKRGFKALRRPVSTPE